MTNIGITSLWEDLDDKLLTPGQLLGYPWKLGGIKVQTSYVEGQWHQKQQQGVTGTGLRLSEFAQISKLFQF